MKMNNNLKDKNWKEEKQVGEIDKFKCSVYLYYSVVFLPYIK